MTLKREDIKKLVINQMLQEGFLDSIRQKMFSKSGASQTNKNPNKKIEAVGDFLQMAQRSKELTALISQTKVGQAAGMKPEQTSQPVTEALGGDFVKQMRQAKITDADLDAFIAEMSKNATAKKMLAGLGLASQDAPQAQQGQQQTQQPQAAQVAAQQQKPEDKKPQQVPIFKATPDSKGDVLAMKLKPLLAKSKVKDVDLILKNYLKLVSNQLKANGIKLMEAKGDNLAAQLSGFTSQTATGLKKGEAGPIAPGTAGTAANVQKGSIDLFGPAVLLLKQAGLDQKAAVTAAKQIRDLTSRHLQKYGVKIPEKALRVPKQQPQKAAEPAASSQQPQKKELGTIGSGEQPGIGFGAKGFDDNQKKQLIRTLSSQGFKAEQVTKVVNTFSDWLKNRSKQQPQQMKEGIGSAQVRELVAQFAKETNLGMDEKLRTALVSATIKAFGSPAQQSGPVQKQAEPAQKDAEVAAKMAGEKNPNPPVDVPRTQSSTIPQPAAPVNSTPPVEDSTGKPVEKPSAEPVSEPEKSTVVPPPPPRRIQANTSPSSNEQERLKSDPEYISLLRQRDSKKITQDQFIKNLQPLQRKYGIRTADQIPKPTSPPRYKDGKLIQEIIAEEIFNLLTGKIK